MDLSVGEHGAQHEFDGKEISSLLTEVVAIKAVSERLGERE